MIQTPKIRQIIDGEMWPDHEADFEVCGERGFVLETCAKDFACGGLWDYIIAESSFADDVWFVWQVERGTSA